MENNTHHRTSEQQEYRDNLAKKLKTARGLGIEGEELAKILLEKEQGKSEYKEAKEGRDGIYRNAIENRDKGIVNISEEELEFKYDNKLGNNFFLVVNTEGNLVLFSDGSDIDSETFLSEARRNGYIENPYVWNEETRKRDCIKESWWGDKLSDFLMGGGFLKFFDEQHGLHGHEQKTIELKVGGLDLGAIDEKFHPAMQKMLEKQYPDYKIIIHPYVDPYGRTVEYGPHFVQAY